MSANGFPYRVRDPKRNVLSIVGVGNPNTLGLSAGATSDYADSATGAVYDYDGTTWNQRANASGGTAAWANITGKPTTIAGYGITDAYTMSASDARYLQLTGGTLTGLVTHAMGTAASNIRATYVSGDTYARWYQNADGSMWWGPGNASQDVNLYRYGANALALNSDLRLIGSRWLYATNYVGQWGGYTNNYAGGAFSGAPNAIVGMSGTTLQQYTATALIAFLAATTSGWYIGAAVGSVPRITYAASAGTAFGLLTAANGYADLYLNDLYVAGGHGLHSTDSGGATFRFASGAPGYLDFLSGDATVAALRMYFNGTLRGYLYANTNGYGLVNEQGGWSVQCFYGTGYGGLLNGSWSVSGNLTVNGDARATRPASPATGVIYLGNSGSTYLYYNGSAYYHGTAGSGAVYGDDFVLN